MRTMIGSPKRWLIILPVLVAAAALLAIGCSSGGGQSDQTKKEGGELFVDPSAPVVDVALTEWSVAPQVAKAEAGSVTFSVTNTGKAKHEFVVVKTDAAASSLAIQNGKVDEESAGESPGEIEGIEPGQTVAKTFDLSPGHYIFLCNIEGHYASGMHADFTVG